jgi:hypothetical protein
MMYLADEGIIYRPITHPRVIVTNSNLMSRYGDYLMGKKIDSGFPSRQIQSYQLLNTNPFYHNLIL